MRTKLLNWFLIFISLSLIVSVVRSFWSLSKGKRVIQETEEKLETTREQQEDLKRQLARSQSPNFIEKQAREKLNLGKEGEIILILPPISPIEEPTPTPIENLPNWQKWVKIFF